jgi:hypothetical protein
MSGGRATGQLGSAELKGDARLGNIFTGYAVEILRDAGYHVVIMDSSTSGINFSAAEKAPVILEGMITTFWVHTQPFARSQVEVALILRDAENGNGLCATFIYGYGQGILWWGASSEFEEFYPSSRRRGPKPSSSYICIGRFL